MHRRVAAPRVDGILRRRVRVDPDAAYRWFTSFEDADLSIQRALKSQRVTPSAPGALVVDRTLDFGEGPFVVHIEIRLRPPRHYDARVHAAEGAFDMTFAFEEAPGGCEVVVTIHRAAGAPTQDPSFLAKVTRSVSQNLDDYLPAMERELTPAAR